MFSIISVDKQLGVLFFVKLKATCTVKSNNFKFMSASKDWDDFTPINYLTNFCSYSLISIKQKYNFDMLAMIWNEIVSWFLKFTKIWKVLPHRNTELFLFWCLDVHNNFMFPTRKNSQKTGKNPEINRQSLVIWWLNSIKYRSVWYLFSCT